MDPKSKENETKDPMSPFDSVIESTPKFLTLFDQVDDMFLDQFDDVNLEFYNQLDNRTKECDVLLREVSLKSPVVTDTFVMTQSSPDRQQLKCPE